MSTFTSGTAITPEDLLNMADGKNYELINGDLVERDMGNESSEIAGRILILIGIFLRGRALGRLFMSDAGFQCFPLDPTRVRKPDVSFVRTGRLPGDHAAKGFDRIAPDLVVEVVSPRDTAEEVEEKIDSWLGAGVRLVWVAYPSTQVVRVHRPRSVGAGRVTDLAGADVISGEDVLPGFTCPVREFFEEVPA